MQGAGSDLVVKRKKDCAERGGRGKRTVDKVRTRRLRPSNTQRSVSPDREYLKRAFESPVSENKGRITGHKAVKESTDAGPQSLSHNTGGLPLFPETGRSGK